MRKPKLTSQKVNLYEKLAFFFFMLTFGAFPMGELNAQCQSNSGTIQGRVFQDLNFDGTEDSNDLPLGNIIVAAYNSGGVKVDETVSNFNSGYTLSNLNDNEVYRLEFTVPSSFKQISISDPSAGAVRFVTAPSCDQILGLHTPADYCEVNPEVAIACFVRGDQNIDGQNETIVSLEYNFSNPSVVSKIDSKSNTGSIHGLVFRQKSQELFTTAFVKQNASLTSNGPGAIFKSKYSQTGNIMSTLFVDLANLGVDVGTLVVNDQDDCTYGYQVGKYGIGDITISDDSDFLYVTNQFDNSIVEVSVINPSASNTRSWSVPDPGCSDGDFNVFAIEEYRGLLYVGCTCTAETSQDPNDSEAIIYEFDPATGVFNQIFQTNKIRGYWKDDMSQHLDTAHWVTDLAFTDEGNMLLSLTDRFGHTFCGSNTGGRADQQYPDLLMVWDNNGTWTLEDNGTAGNLVGCGVGNGQGPGGGEFFLDEWSFNPSLHPEQLLGTVYVLPGSGQVIATAYDPLVDSYSGGVIRYSTSDGCQVSAKQLYSRNFDQFFGKATGFGDMDVLCSAFDISIGNLVWADNNSNGIQDAGEEGISDLELCLFDAQGSLITRTVTDQNGNYLFDSSNVDLNGDGEMDGLEFNECYYLAVTDPDYNTANQMLYKNGIPYMLTVSNAQNLRSNMDSDMIDNDGEILTGQNSILFGLVGTKILTGGSGENDYAIDFGFTSEMSVDLALKKELSNGSIVRLGDTVTYNITIFNQGNVDTKNIEVVDYINAGYTFDTSLNPDWTFDATNNVASNTINTVLAAGDDTQISITLLINNDATYASLLNIAEIASSEDVFDMGLLDTDSTPDSDPFNDAGVQPIPNSAGTDDEINDDGSTDEDDHDFARVSFMDLALLKQVKNPQEFYLPGEYVDYEIIVYNQGTEDAMSIVVSDYIPSGLLFEGNLNKDWILQNDSLAYFEIPGTLLIGQTDTLNITLQVDPDFEGIELINSAEISASRSARTAQSVDFDSFADQNRANDDGGVPDSPSDNEINERIGSDEDDEDPAKIKTRFFDLALTKTTTTNTVAQGDDITFQITITNQGTTPADNIVISDYIPAGTSLADADWTANGAGNFASITLSSTNGLLSLIGLLPGSSVIVDITLNVGLTTTPGEYVNFSEISAATDELGTDMSNDDIDSNADVFQGNDIGSTPNSPEDDHIDDDGVDSDADGITDEDDYDPASFNVISSGVSNSCICLNNATTTTPGEYQDDIAIEGPCGQAWEVSNITGAPISIAVGDLLLETPTSTPGICTYTISVVHDAGSGYGLSLVNNLGESQKLFNTECPLYTVPECSGSLSVCMNEVADYSIINSNPLSTYNWAIPAGSGTLSAPTGEFVTITWGTTGSYVITITETNPSADFCGAPIEKEVNVGLAGGSIICHGNLNFSLNQTCELVVTPETISAEPLDAGIPYVVMLTDGHGQIIPNNTLNHNHIGQEITAKLIDGCGGNNCWSFITVEDKLGPEILCPSGPIVVSCFEIPDFIPSIVDNCDDLLDIQLISELTINENCDSDYLRVIERVYSATDKSGNTSISCPITINVEKADLSLVVLSPKVADPAYSPDFLFVDNRALTCDAFPLDDNGHPDPCATGVPTLNGIALYPPQNETSCQLAAIYNDRVTYTDDCKIKIIREWLVAEDCSSFGEIIRLNQAIEIVDPVPPMITCPRDFVVTTDGFSCEASISLPVPEVSDNCSEVINIQVSSDFGFIDNFTGTQKLILPAGRHRIEYGAIDGCHNENWCWFYVTVEDHTPPVAVCDNHTVVGLSGNGADAHVNAYTFDDGSFDDCGLDRFLVRRMDSIACDCTPPKLDDYDLLGEFGGHYYYLSNNEMLAPKAFQFGDALGGYVVTVNNNAERVWLRDRVVERGNPDYLIGYNDVAHEGVFEWVGPSSPFVRWFGTNPDMEGDYVMVRGSGDLWDDFDGTVIPKRFIIEVEDPCGFSSNTVFCCADTGTEQQVVFRVIDNWGNYNDCMVNVEVQDKNPPTISCPPDVTIDCDVIIDLTDLTAYGEAIAEDECQVVIEELEPVANINSCRSGTIERFFVARDANGNVTCSQTITIEDGDLFDFNDIDFPDDLTVEDECADESLLPENLPMENSRPIFMDDECNLVGISYEDQLFPFAGNGACLKLIRTWTVINWCDENTLTNPIVHPQVIKINNTIDPELQLRTPELEVCTFDNNCEEGYIELIAVGRDDCTPKEELSFTYTIDLDSDGTVDITNASFGNEIDASGVYPIGQHTIVYNVEDRCGNTVGASEVFTIKNCKAPTAACIGKITVTIEPWDLDGDGEPEIEAACIFASQFDASSSHPCGFPVQMSFSPDAVIEKDTVDCGDVGTNMITIYVIDSNGNVDECNVELCVQNNTPDFCPDPKECILFPEEEITIEGCSVDLSPEIIGSEITLIEDCPLNANNYQFNFSDSETTNGDGCRVLIRTFSVLFNNSEICTFEQTITVLNSLPPSIRCRPTQLSAVATNNCEAFVDIPDVRILSSCSSDLVLTHDFPGGQSSSNASGNYPVGVTVVVYTATDPCGNQSTCQYTITVTDNEPPVCNVEDLTIPLTDEGTVSVGLSDLTVSGSDACGGEVTFEILDNIFDCSDIDEQNVVTVVVTDDSGNTSSCTADITLSDENVAPICVANDITVSLDDNGVAIIDTDLIGAGSSIGCSDVDPNIAIAIKNINCTNLGVSDVIITVSDNFGNSSQCTAEVTVQDDNDPVCNIDDITVSLGSDGTVTVDISDLNFDAMDICDDNPTAIFTPVTFDCDNIGDNPVTVTVTDAAGNTSECTATVNVRDDSSVPMCMANDISVMLDASGNATITAAQIGSDSTDGCDGGTPMLAIDQTDFDCSDVGEVIVTLTVTDSDGNSNQCTSTVTVMDNNPPDCNVNDITVSLGADGTTMIDFDDVDNGSSDDCGTIVSAILSENTFGCEAVGLNDITVTLTDNSGNQSTCDLTVTVEEMLPPICIVQDITVNLDGTMTGQVSLTPDLVDNGSFDPCGQEIELDIVPDFVACNDVGEVTYTFTATDSDGLTCTTTGIITVVSPLPELTCPDDVVIGCDVSIDDLDDFGSASDVAQGCFQTVEETVVMNINTCNIGFIERTFTVSDGIGNMVECTQVIQITGPSNPVTIDDITFPPATIELDACVSIDPADLDGGMPTVDISNAQCSNISIDFNDVISGPQIGQQRCPLDIDRTFTVIDSCQLNGDGSTGIFTFVQTITVNDNDDPVLSECPDLTITLPPGVCDTMLTDLVALATDCDINVTLTNDSPFADDNNSGDFSGNYEAGITTVTITAEDFCGNVSSKEVVINVISNEFQSYTCEKIVVFIEDTSPPSVVVHAEDVVMITGESCDGTLGLSGSYSNTNINDTLRVFGCSEIGDTEDLFYIYDDGVLIDSCFIIVTVLDDFVPITNPNAPFCLNFDDEDQANVSGLIVTEQNEGVENVSVNLDGAGMEYMTDSQGQYAFPQMPFTGDYEVRPIKNVGHMNGVSTLDIIMIQRHILDAEPLDSPYKIIAGDVNNSRSLSVLDLVDLRKMILGITEEFPNNNTSWRMVDAAYEFDDPTKPLREDFNETYEIENLDANMQINFVGIKVGDVNGNASPNQFNSTEIRTLTEDLDLKLAVEMIGDTKIAYHFYATNFTDILGFQFSLGFDEQTMRYNHIEQANLSLSDNNIGSQLKDRGLLSFSFNSTNAQSFSKDDQLFTLVFDLTSIGSPDYELSVGSEITTSEAYSNQGVSGISLGYLNTIDDPSKMNLYQNSPNPWSESTTLSFYLPQATEAEITFYDVMGRVIHKIDGTYKKGYQNVTIDHSDLNTSGVIYYELRNQDERLMHKMLLLK